MRQVKQKKNVSAFKLSDLNLNDVQNSDQREKIYEDQFHIMKKEINELKYSLELLIKLFPKPSNIIPSDTCTDQDTNASKVKEPPIPSAAPRVQPSTFSRMFGKK